MAYPFIAMPQQTASIRLAYYKINSVVVECRDVNDVCEFKSHIISTIPNDGVLIFFVTSVLASSRLCPVICTR